jgi:hypothetical protein
MTRRTLILDTPERRELAATWARNAPLGTRVEWKAPKRTTDQNALLWACLGDIAAQVMWHGLKLSAEDWKIIMLDALKRDLRMVPNLEGNGYIQLGRSSSDLSKEEMSTLIELLYAFGDRNGVTFGHERKAAA